MPDSAVFEHICGELDRETALSTLEARGTVRLALQDSGLSSSSLVAEEAMAVLRRVIPGELSSRGVDDAEAVCARIVEGLKGAGAAATTDASAPEAVCKRLGR